jgi:ubiquinone/menaquinone biosynthesis C-methylase UbiE
MNKNQWISQFDQLILNPFTREMYGQEAFFNVGYWQENTKDQQQACFDLMEKLLAFIPEKKGNILDVGCGLGATTKYLLNFYSPDNVLGINISSRQLEQAKINAPNCQFMLMDAVAMDFEDHTFDTIICVEAAFYFDTREQFLREAKRILKPGGNLIMSDILFKTTKYLGDWTVPKANIINSIEDYQNLYQQIGFKSFQLIEATEECWFRHFRYMKNSLTEDLQRGTINQQDYNFNITAIDNLLNTSAISYYLAGLEGGYF